MYIYYNVYIFKYKYLDTSIDLYICIDNFS